jgi:hypothetical protein
MKKDYTARRADTYTLKEAIGELLNAYKLRGKYNETYLVSSWSRIMGVAIANRTGRIYISNRKLFVQITSAPLKSELAMSKSKIVEILNREAREDVLEDVIFI